MSNKGRSYSYRNAVLLLLHEHGFHMATKPGEPRGLPPDQKLHGDITGLPVSIAVRCTQTLDLSGALKEAQAEALAEGNRLYVSIHSRRNHPIEDSFVVTDLSTWLAILARLHPEALTS